MIASLTPSSGLTAAGSPIVGPRSRSAGPKRRQSARNGNGTDPLDPATPDAIRARSQKWQHRILEYAEAVPEVAGAAALVRASIERVEWIVEGTGDAETGGKARAQARVDSLDKERAAELIWLSGESYVGVPDDDGVTDPAELALYSLSVAECNATADPKTVLGPNGEQVDLEDPIMRIWRASKGNRWQASSPNKAAMDLLDAMYLSQLADTAVHRSRLAGAGVVFWPTNAPDVPVEAGEDPVAGSRQALAAAFEDAAWESIEKQNSREAVIPFVVFYDPGEGKTTYTPEMFRIEREGHASDYALGVTTRRDRYAGAVELPIEAVTGMGSTNHWSAWQIDVDKWKTWFAPLCELIRVELERRVVKLYGKGLTLKVDASALISKPDQTDVIVKLMQLEQVTPESGVKALITGKLEDLQWQAPPAKDYTSNAAPGQPSDFGRGDTNRGGGKFREQP